MFNKNSKLGMSLFFPRLILFLIFQMMTGRKPNYFLNRERFGCTVKKPGVQNQNRNHMDNRKLGYFSGSLMNQVDPWLPENNTTALSNFGRYICTDPQAQLALASNLLNNLLAPTSHLNELAQVCRLRLFIPFHIEMFLIFRESLFYLMGKIARTVLQNYSILHIFVHIDSTS